MNQQFLQHNYYTDIISFNLATKGQPIQGEIYISLDRVLDNAKTLDQPFAKELHRVIFHGALHLCGYKDKSAKDIATMRAKEDYYISYLLQIAMFHESQFQAETVIRGTWSFSIFALWQGKKGFFPKT